MNTIRLAKPEKAAMVENMLVQMARRGQLGGQLGEDELRGLLEKVSEQTKQETTVKFDRRRAALDDDWTRVFPSHFFTSRNVTKFIALCRRCIQYSFKNNVTFILFENCLFHFHFIRFIQILKFHSITWIFFKNFFYLRHFIKYNDQYIICRVADISGLVE